MIYLSSCLSACLPVWETDSLTSKRVVTFGIAVFSMFNIVVIVNTDVIPRAIRAAVASGGIQNDIHDNITISAHGA